MTSAIYTDSIARNLRDTTGNPPVWHRFAAFVVLKAPDIPSILFESGYLTNAVDAAYISSPEGRQRIAEGMRRAIEAHFARRLLDGRE